MVERDDYPRSIKVNLYTLMANVPNSILKSGRKWIKNACKEGSCFSSRSNRNVAF